MINLKITDVRVLPGDSAFLIDDGKTAVLYDTGFGFTAQGIVTNIQQALGERKLDYILLTHSHYDHVLAAPAILRRYPEAKVIAGEYVQKIFAKPTARATMRSLDRSAAAKEGISDYEDLADELRVDVTVADGDMITLGDMAFRVIALPGHTKCSVGFYLEENGLLLGVETLGVYFGRDTYLPNYLVGYQMTLDSYKKARALNPKQMLIPHYGLVGHEEAMAFLAGSEHTSVETAMRIREILASGGTKEAAFDYFKEAYYTERIRPAYPIEAFKLNTGILINLIERELLGGPKE
ncbi:MAG: MBL fold metallo-hydrolase [Clostridia bacterium]|nr:MBL fold metallo-hydrolase [Clostridia bacterium]